ncbi:MAG TPA: MCE family protein [Acidimicrobiales bacterium]|jgi:virulence factor Mce-like protein|nr:MCE family protein [Acidimicrobiales bacterium]
MISKRLIANLIAFFVVSAVLVGYGVVNLLGNPLRSSTVLTTEFPDASGLYPNFIVELNGVPVGTVGAISLTARGTKITMDIHPGTKVPGDVRSSIQIANDLGEQVVDLIPAHGGTAPALRSGDNVPVSPNQIPANVGQVVQAATKLLQAIPAGDLNKLIGELATSLKGRAADLRTIITAGTTFSQEFVAYEKQFTELLANAPTALDTVTAVAPELKDDLANTAALLQVLAEQKTGLDTLFKEGSTAVSQVNQLVTTQSANLGCIFHDAANVLSNLAQPANLTNLSQGLTYNEFFFGAINSVAAPGLAKATTSNGKDIPNQLFLRTRLLIPPVLAPAATTYATPNQIPDILPGAACVTVYGNGVGAATQAGFTPADGGHVVAPTAQDADVELNGATPVPATPSADVMPGQSQWALLALGGLLVPALLLLWGARPSRRRARRRA